VLPLADPVHDRREADGEVGSDWCAVLVHVPPQW
jgi:hypothetical protein